MSPTNEVPTTEVRAPGQDALESGLAKRAETNQLVVQAHEALGGVAAGPVVTPSGVETPRDRTEELRMRELNGHSYQR